MASLTAVNGPDAGRKYELTGSEWVLGRLPECQIVIPVGAVSRQHARLWRDGSSYFIEDLNSRNGTLLNDQLIKERRKLEPGDKLKICDVEFTFAPDAPTSPLLSSAFGRLGQPEVLIDDLLSASSSKEMSKLDVSSGQMQLTASPEARLRAMLEITQSLGKALALDDVLPKVLNTCFKLFVQADRGLILLRTDDGRIIPRWTKTRRTTDEDTIRVSRTIINKVIDSREAILSEDASNDSQFAMSQSIADFKIRSVMCAPLIDTAGKAFGALQIDTLDRRGRFKSDDLELLVSIATQAAIAIDNAQLYEKALQQQSFQRDLELAREVQKGFLPESHPDVPGYQFFHYYEPMVYVGGDYFDYIPLPDGRLAIIVADVVGHGVAAALMMAKLSAEARYCLVAESAPGKAVAKLNNRIVGLGLDRFITMILVVLNPKTHELTIVSAGHMAPIIRRGNGAIEEPGIKEGGFALGIMETPDYEEVTVSLEAGDLFVLYTDGINEASDETGQQYTCARLKSLVAGQATTPTAVGQAIIQDVRLHLGKHTQDDDMCLVCISRHT